MPCLPREAALKQQDIHRDQRSSRLVYVSIIGSLRLQYLNSRIVRNVALKAGVLVSG